MEITKTEMEYELSRKAFNSEQYDELLSLYKDKINIYNVNVTGDACVGDEIVFSEAVFVGSYPKSHFSHFQLIEGKIIKDSYGKEKQQHTFTIETTGGIKLKRKGRNIYKYITLSKPRNSEERIVILQEKHQRGNISRNKRQERIKEKVERQCENLLQTFDN